MPSQVLTSFIYSCLRKRGLLRGFGYVPATPTFLPVATKDIDVPTLEAETGLALSALTPKGTQFTWQIAGLVVCAAEYAITQQVSPGQPFFPLTGCRTPPSAPSSAPSSTP